METIEFEKMNRNIGENQKTASLRKIQGTLAVVT